MLNHKYIYFLVMLDEQLNSITLLLHLSSAVFSALSRQRYLFFQYIQIIKIGKKIFGLILTQISTKYLHPNFVTITSNLPEKWLKEYKGVKKMEEDIYL